MIMKSNRLVNIKAGVDLLILNAASVILILAVLFAPESPLRVFLGIPFLLFFPGYTLISLLFPSNHDLGKIARIALSLGSSLCIVPLVGLALNYAPWGITLTPIMSSMFLLTLLFSIISQYRRFKLPIQEKSNKYRVKWPTWSRMPKVDRFFIVSILVAALIVGGFAVYLATGPKTGEHFTEFYLLGSNGKLADYPVNLSLGENGTVILGITNHEHAKVNYEVLITEDNETIQTIRGIELDDRQTWSKNFTYSPTVLGGKVSLEFLLYKQDMFDVCQRLQLWVAVREPT